MILVPVGISWASVTSGGLHVVLLTGKLPWFLIHCFWQRHDCNNHISVRCLYNFSIHDKLRCVTGKFKGPTMQATIPQIQQPSTVGRQTTNQSVSLLDHHPSAHQSMTCTKRGGVWVAQTALQLLNNMAAYTPIFGATASLLKEQTIDCSSNGLHTRAVSHVGHLPIS